MLLKAKKDMNFQILESYNEKTDKAKLKDMALKKGEIIDVDIVWSGKKKSVWEEIEFYDGCIAYNLPRKLFTVIKK